MLQNREIMKLFSFFKKKSTEETLRERLHDYFEDRVKFALKNGTGNPMFDGMMIQASVGSFYQEMKKNKELEYFCYIKDLDYQTILQNEYTKVLNKFKMRV